MLKGFDVECHCETIHKSVHESANAGMNGFRLPGQFSSNLVKSNEAVKQASYVHYNHNVT